MNTMATNNYNDTPFRVVHPCKGLKDEIRARGMQLNEFASRMRMKPSNVSRLFNGETDITIDMAQRLESALGIPAQTWITLQMRYNDNLKAISARDEEEKRAIETESEISKILNLPILFKELKIKSTLLVCEKLSQLRDKLKIDITDINQLTPIFAGDYKKSDKFIEDKRNLRTWILLATYYAQNNSPDTKYSCGNARKAAQEIADAANTNGITEKVIQSTLNNYGIAYYVLKNLEKTHIDAFSKMINNTPCVVTTHRHNDMSRLIFNILHELGHIELHIEKGEIGGFIALDGTYSSDDIRESEANTFAQNCIINPELWESMMETQSKIGDKSIVSTLRRLSSENNLNFNLVLWRYRYETQRYNIIGGKSNPIV